MHKTKYRNSSIFLIIALIFIAFISLFPFVLSNSVFSQDDLGFHVTRLESYYQSVIKLDFFPKVFPNIAHSYGYGADIFYPSVLLLPYTFLRTVGLSFVSSYYIYQFLISFATAIISYYCMLNYTNSRRQSYVFSLIYTLSTYRLIDQFVRGALGETLAFIFVPLVALGLYKIVVINSNNFLLLSVGMTFLVLSHMITAFLVTLSITILFAYLVIKKKGRQCLTLVKAGMLSLLLSSFVWLPIIEQYFHQSFNTDYTDFTREALNYGLGDLLINSLTTLTGSWKHLQPNFGVPLLMILLVAIYFYNKLKFRTRFSKLIP